MISMKIASMSHKNCGNGYCKCGETVDDCWWLQIYFPYLELNEQAKWEALLDG